MRTQQESEAITKFLENHAVNQCRPGTVQNKIMCSAITAHGPQNRIGARAAAKKYSKNDKIVDIIEKDRPDDMLE